MIIAGPGIAPGVCATPVDLLDLYPAILQGAGLDPAPEMSGRPGQALQQLAAAPAQPERPVFSEYHAAGSNTAGFLLRVGRYKLLYYVRHRPELFDLEADPEELHDLAGDPAQAAILKDMEARLRAICDPEAIDALCKADQRAMIERLGGEEVASQLGATGATPAPASKH